MAKSNKPTPKTQKEIINSTIEPYELGGYGNPNDSKKKNRAHDISVEGDKEKIISIGLADIDNAVLYYLTNVVRPYVKENGQMIKVPVEYAFPERWNAAQKQGHLRDKEGRMLLPAIIVKREGITRNRTLGNKLDGNSIANYQVFEKQYSRKNHYDRFSLINNRIPVKEYYMAPVPDYITVNYQCSMFTNNMEQLNDLIEAMNFVSDSYWGEYERFKFKATIESFTSVVEYSQGEDRSVRSDFSVTLNGYIIPDSIQKELISKKKYLSKAQVVFTMETTEGDIDRSSLKAAQDKKKNSVSTFVGQGVVNNYYNTTINNNVRQDEMDYINTNIPKKATTVTAPDIAIFSGNVLTIPSGSSLPQTNVESFKFFINGQYVPSSIITFVTGSGIVTATFDIPGLGYALESDDEVIAIGKWQN
jgi:hypothetical protein